jgi:hypothetical protein
LGPRGQTDRKVPIGSGPLESRRSDPVLGFFELCDEHRRTQQLV